MSWLYVPVSAEASNLDSNLPSQPLAQSVTWRGKPIRSLSHSPVFAKVISTMRRSGAMSNPSTARRGVKKWIASLAATPASPSACPVDAKGQTIPDTSGPISGESSLKSNPGSASLKTWLDIFNLVLNQYGETFADWATRLRQDSLRRQKLAPHINDSGFSSWPTPDHQAGTGGVSRNNSRVRFKDVATRWPTPMAADDGKKVTTSSLQAGLIGRASGFYGPPIPTIAQDGRKLYTSSRVLNPRFVEWLMGFPIGWTALQPLETASYQQWQQQHGDNLERRR